MRIFVDTATGAKPINVYCVMERIKECAEYLKTKELPSDFAFGMPHCFIDPLINGQPHCPECPYTLPDKITNCYAEIAHWFK